MCTEIEAKLKVESHKQIAARLAKLGAEFLEEQVQTDSYFDDAGRAFTKTDRCLRLRRQTTGKGEKTFLTYKGPREKDEFKKRQEIEIEVKDTDSVEKLLLALAYEKKLAFEKERRIWRLGQCVVALDKLPLLGSFVEVEGPDDETIANAQKDLRLSDLPHIKESYASLMEAKLRQLNKKERKIFWESQNR
jgi:adenylate cyclase class 2